MNLRKTFFVLLAFWLIIPFISCDNSSDNSEWQEVSTQNFELSAGTYDLDAYGSYSQDLSNSGVSLSISANINFSGTLEIAGTEDDDEVKTTLDYGEIKAVYKIPSEYYKTVKENLSESYIESGYDTTWNDKNNTVTLSHTYTEEELETSSSSTTYSELVSEIKENNVKIYVSEENPNKFKLQYEQSQEVESLGKDISVPITIIATKTE